MTTNKTNGTIWAHELVALQASQTPEALAVQDEKQKLTFAELDRRANRLAHHLRTLGVGSEVAVGLYFERSVDFVVAALAVLKAGGAYVPLDVAHPLDRIERILKDAGVGVLLSHHWMAANLSAGPWKTVDLDIDRALLWSYSAEALNINIEGPQLAYIIYTSGSTGQPKGVEITHSNLRHLIKWHHRAFGVSNGDRASQIAGLAFDAAVWEIWCHLTAGASIHLIDEISRRSAEGLRAWLYVNRITISFAPTILAEQLIVLHWSKKSPLRLLLTGADTLHRFPRPNLPFAVVNNYGPTECTVLVTSGLVAKKHRSGQIPPIGWPISDTEILILDAELKPVANGEEGEICVAGPQVGRGYRNLPELTAEKFAREPVGGRRIYRTGDRGRVLKDGQIDFLGRLDDQIKVRGFRVEPDEVIAHLNMHSGIRSSTLIARENEAGEKVLVAYVVTATGKKVTASELKRFLKLRVPDHMVPSTFVSLPSLPVTSTGKCDRQALPAPGPENEIPQRAWSNDLSRPQNATELHLSQLVNALLNTRSVQRDENFFTVGGHSMLAAQLLARVRENFQVSLSLRQLFESPTIASLASVVDSKLGHKDNK